MVRVNDSHVNFDTGEESFVQRFLRQTDRSLNAFRVEYNQRFGYYPGPEVIALLEISDGDIVKGYVSCTIGEHYKRSQGLSGV